MFLSISLFRLLVVDRAQETGVLAYVAHEDQSPVVCTAAARRVITVNAREQVGIQRVARHFQFFAHSTAAFFLAASARACALTSLSLFQSSPVIDSCVGAGLRNGSGGSKPMAIFKYCLR